MKIQFFRYVSLGAAVGALIVAGPVLAGDASKSGKSADEVVKMMDTNGDGAVSPDEHSVGARKMFEEIDANKDGRVTEAEMNARHAMKKAEHGSHEGRYDKSSNKPMSSKDKIKDLDTNGDGTLTAEEHATGSRTMFQKMDANRDNRLTAEEVRMGHEKLMSEKKGGEDKRM